MLDLSIKEQKQIVGGTKYKVYVYDENDNLKYSRTFSNEDAADAWGEKMASRHPGYTYYTYIV